MASGEGLVVGDITAGMRVGGSDHRVRWAARQGPEGQAVLF